MFTMKYYCIFCLLLIVSFAAKAQKETITLDDFESGAITFTSKININPATDMRVEVVDNPSKTGIDKSDKVLGFERIGTVQKWAGFWADLNEAKKDYKYLHLKYYRTNSTSIVRINAKPKGGKSNNEFFPMFAPSKTNEWESLVFDLATNKVTDLGTLGIQPDFSDTRELGTKVYIDDIILSDDLVISTEFTTQRPIGLFIETETPTALTLKWSKLAGAVSYDVYKEGQLYRSGVTENTIEIPGLKTFDIFYFSVIAKNAEGDFSKESEFLYAVTPETKEQKDARMAWWREARFGMFIHWGVYASFAGNYDGPTTLSPDKMPYYSCFAPSMINPDGTLKIDPATGKEYTRGQYAEWIMFAAQIPRANYLEKAYSSFKAENYNAKEWVRMAKDAGMKYIVITSKHHDGYTLMKGVPGYGINDPESQIKKDVLGELVTEARAAGLKIGFYYSQTLDWLNPGGMGWIPQNTTPDKKASYEDRSKYVDNIVVPHLEKMVKDYGVDVIWWDMGGDSSPEFRYRTLKAVKNIAGAERLLFNPRLEDHMSADFKTPEQNIPNMPATGDGTDWETCMTMNDNWGYCAHDFRWKTTQDLLTKLIDIVSKGGNFLLNIGPKADGTFPQESVDRLSQIGQWTKVNGEAIWGTTANPFPTPPAWGKVTQKVGTDGKTTLYFHVLNWPANGKLEIPCLHRMPNSVEILGNDATITPAIENRNLVLNGLPTTAPHAISTTIKMVLDELTETDFALLCDNSGKFKLTPDNASSVKDLIVQNMPSNFGGWSSSVKEYISGKGAEWIIYVPNNTEYSISGELMAVENGTLNIDVNSLRTDCGYTASTLYDIQNFSTKISLPAGTHRLQITRTSTVDKWNYINLRSLILTPENASGINNQQVSTISIETTKGMLTVNGVNQGDMLHLYDVMGRLIISRTATGSTEQIALSTGSSILILKVFSENRPTEVKKFQTE